MLKQKKWLDQNIPSLNGKRFLVTGSTSGIGYEAARSLLYKGGEVTLACRNPQKAEKCISDILVDIPGAKVDALFYNQSDPQSIRHFVETLSANKSYDAIILNAGIYYPKKGSTAPDGTSITFMTNAVGTFLLYDLFHSKFPQARCVFVSSVVNITPKGKDYKNYVHQGGMHRANEYGVSKRAIMNLFGYALIHDSSSFYLTHPGVTGTAIFDGFPPLFRKLGHRFLNLFVHRPWKACLGEVLLAAGEFPSGSFAYPRGPFHISGYPKTGRFNKKKVFRDAEALHSTLKNEYES